MVTMRDGVRSDRQVSPSVRANCGTSAVETSQLEAEIERLREELEKAHESVEYWHGQWEMARLDLFEEKKAHETTKRRLTKGR